jgi:hypothetical protein
MLLVSWLPKIGSFPHAPFLVCGGVLYSLVFPLVILVDCHGNFIIYYFKLVDCHAENSSTV